MSLRLFETDDAIELQEIHDFVFKEDGIDGLLTPGIHNAGCGAILSEERLRRFGAESRSFPRTNLEMYYPKTTENLISAPTEESEQATGSFLVRLWIESTEDEVPVRGYVRNLRTGEECYVGDTDRLGEHLLRQFRGEQKQVETVPLSRQSTRQSA